jgi:signal transduction histidine kinase
MGHHRGMASRPSRLGRPLAALIAGLTVVIFVAGVVKHAIDTGAPGLLDWLGLVGIVTFLLFPVMGLLLVRRQPSNAVGWLLLGIGLAVYLIFNSGDFASAHYRGPLPISQVFGILNATTWIPFILMLLLFLPMLFPDGRLLSRRWWIPIVSGLVFALLALVGNIFNPTNGTIDNPGLPNPLANPDLARTFAPLANLSVPFGLLAFIGSVSSVVVRYRRGNSLQRHQIRWFLFALLLAATPFLLHDVNHLLSNVLLVLFVPLLPTSVAIAVLRYRLYDIDVVINRALVYGALAAFITAVYVGIVVGIGRLAGSGNRPNVALSIVATAVVAVAFQPVRERVQRLANRLVYGKRATPYEVMAGFADQMAATLSADEVLPQMAEAAARGVGAQAARVTLYLPGGVRRSTVWPVKTSGNQFARMLPVSYRGDPVGEIAVRESPGQPITPGEGRLLADLAGQAGLVLHNVRLTAELEARLDDITEQAAELSASRQRIVAAQETERRRLGAEIRAGVQHDLEATADRLDEVERLLSSDAAAAAERLDWLTTETQRALDGLRELAHGIFPPLLADKGIVPALQAHARKTANAASIEAPAELAGTRFDAAVEAAVYFCCTEALRTVDGPAAVRLAASDGVLTFTIEGVVALNGRLHGLRDRVEALGGSLTAEIPGRLDGWLPAHSRVTAG